MGLHVRKQLAHVGQVQAPPRRTSKRRVIFSTSNGRSTTSLEAILQDVLAAPALKPQDLTSSVFFSVMTLFTTGKINPSADNYCFFHRSARTSLLQPRRLATLPPTSRTITLFMQFILC